MFPKALFCCAFLSLVLPSGAVRAGDLLASTYLGHLGKDGLFEDPMVFGADGSVYIADRTASDSFPTTPGAYQPAMAGGASDIFIARFSHDLSTLIACTFLGGSGEDAPWPGVDLTLDADGNVYVVGTTYSSDFPTSETAYRRTRSGPSDFFVAKLSPDLSTLLAATYLGGSASEDIARIRITGDNRVLVCGTTGSSDFPTPGTVWDTSYNGDSGGQHPGDFFAARLDIDLSTIEAATFVGGSGDEYCEAIEFDGEGNICFAGWTTSTNYQTTPSAYRPTYRGGSYDGFVTKLSADLSGLLGSTYLGGSQWDFVYGLAVESDGSILVTGHTASTNFPTTEGVFDRSYNGTGTQGVDDDCFVSRLSGDLTTLQTSTFLGHNKWEIGTDLEVDELGRIYVAGSTTSWSFFTTDDSYDPSHNGSEDVFLVVFDPALTFPVAGTYLGGAAHDILGCILIDASGNVFFSGSTDSPNFPTVTGSYDESFNGAGGPWSTLYGGDVYLSLMPVGYFTDSDQDYRVDASDNCPFIANSDQADLDGDEVGDACDECTDSDGDGFGDPGFAANTCQTDNCPAVPNPGQGDADLDGVGDICDNCPDTPNPLQEDENQNQIGDACEGCCVGRVGDANGQGGDEPTIGDVSTIIDALFITGSSDPLICLAEADINQSGGADPVFEDITVGDISALVDYLFITGPSLGLGECL